MAGYLKKLFSTKYIYQFLAFVRTQRRQPVIHDFTQQKIHASIGFNDELGEKLDFSMLAYKTYFDTAITVFLAGRANSPTAQHAAPAFAECLLSHWFAIRYFTFYNDDICTRFMEPLDFVRYENVQMSLVARNRIHRCFGRNMYTHVFLVIHACTSCSITLRRDAATVHLTSPCVTG